MPPTAWRSATRAGPTDPELAFTGIRGTEITNPEVLQAQVGLARGAKLDLRSAQSDIATLYGRGDFSRIDYRLSDMGGQRDVEFVVSEKSWGPNFLLFGVGFASDMQGDNAFGLRVRHKRTWLNSLGGEWINDVEVGTTNLVRTEFYQPLNLAQTWFASAYGSIAGIPQSVFSQGVKVADYDVLDERAGVDLGYALASWGDVRIGPRYVHERADPTVASPDFPVTKQDEWGSSSSARVDTQDNAFFPRRGLRLSRVGVHGDAAAGRRAIASVHARGARRPTSRSRSASATRSTSALRVAGTNVFEPTLARQLPPRRIPRDLRVAHAELQGAYVGRARAVYLHRMGTLPVFGNTYYARRLARDRQRLADSEAPSRSATPTRRAACSSRRTRLFGPVLHRMGPRVARRLPRGTCCWAAMSATAPRRWSASGTAPRQA